jgi:hypothetical protein
MEATAHQHDSWHNRRETTGENTVPMDLEASARELLAAHDAHVRDALNSVEWERRGLLQRLIRGPR